jgi:hypothetical protein
MSDAIATARELLARAGIALDAAASPADVAVALARAEATADRATRKEIRRALYRLGQTGVQAPASPTEPAAPSPVLGPMVEAWISAVDGRGDRLAWLVREQPSGGLVLVAAEINEPLGLRDLRALEPTRKQLRTMRQRFQTEAALTLVPADWRAVDALVIEAQDRLETPDRKLDYRRMRSRITSQPPAAPTELVSARVHEPTDGDERARLTAESAALLSEPELRTWWPRPDEAAPLLAEIRAIRESPLVVSEAQQGERLNEVVARASRTLYPAPVVARRLQATAFVFAETNRLDAARRSLAAAATLRANPDAEVPLLQALAFQGLGAQLAAMESGQRDERADALVLTPGEIKARSASRPPRSRG